MELRGWISEFTEQGMEGEVWRIFQDEAFSDSSTHGWRYEGLRQLADGDTLTILDAGDRILWRGILRAQTRWLGLAASLSPVDAEWHPSDVSLDTWSGWFRSQPPLRAILVPSEVSRS
jgi:hypothetical protein